MILISILCYSEIILNTDRPIMEYTLNRNHVIFYYILLELLFIFILTFLVISENINGVMLGIFHKNAK